MIKVSTTFDLDYVNRLMRQTDKNTLKAAAYTAGRLRAVLPVRTGNLKTTVGIKAIKNGYKIDAAYYLFWIEKGAYGHDGTHIVDTMMQAEEGKILAIMAEGI
jgi:hypothetical protein